MDLFTHMMLSYILSVICGATVGHISEAQLLFGVIAGIFPDLDILTFPLWKKVPLLHHHGITHSLVFPIVNSLVLSGIVWLVWGSDPLLFIPIGMLTGVFHVISDLLTNYPVPLFAPRSWKGYSWAIDSAVNPYLMFPVLVLIFGFWQLRARAYPFEVFSSYLLLVGLVICGHLLVKLGIKLYIKKKYRGRADEVDAEPSIGYRVWYLVLSTRILKNILSKFYKIKLGSKKRGPVLYDVTGPSAKVDLPIDTKHKAILLSYSALRKEGPENFINEGEYACRVLDDPGTDGGYKVFWFFWWASFRSSVKGNLVDVEKDGTYSITSISTKLPIWK